MTVRSVESGRPSLGAPIEANMPWHGLPHNAWFPAPASYLRDVSSQMLVHPTPLLLSNVLGARLSLVGLIQGVAETTAGLTKKVAGWWSDRSGRRQPLTTTRYAVAALGVPGLTVSATWGQVLVARFLDRMGKGIRTAPRDALLADSVPAERRGAAFGVHRAADSAVAFNGLALAMVPVRQAQRRAPSSAADMFRTVEPWAIVPAVLAALVPWLGVRERARGGNTRASTRSDAGVLDARFRRCLFVVFLFTLGNSTDAFLVLRAQAGGAFVLEVLGMLAVFSLVYSLVLTPLGTPSDRVDRRKLIAGAWLLYAVVYMGFGLAGAPRATHARYRAENRRTEPCPRS